MNDEEEPPVHPEIELKEFKTIYKTEKWWSVVTKQISFDKKEIAYYLFHKEEGIWRRKQKASFKQYTQWREIKLAIEDLWGMKKEDEEPEFE